MDEIERRLTDALAREAAAIKTTPVGWDETTAGHHRSRRTWTIVMAAAAVVIVILGIGLAVRFSDPPQIASAPPSDTEKSLPSNTSRPLTPAACDSGWTAFSGRVIQRSGNTTSTGGAAVVFFSPRLPPAASLCALTIGPDGKTTASGGTNSDGSALGYLTTMTGDKSYLIGAFAEPVTAVTFRDRRTDWSVTISASTKGLTDLGNRWYGYVVLAPAVDADVTVIAKSANGKILADEQLGFGGGRVTAPSSISGKPTH